MAERALHRTSFNRVLLAGMRGRIQRSLAFPVTWVAAADVAPGRSPPWTGAWPESATVDRSTGGHHQHRRRFNRACELAGIDHRVEDLDYRSDPEALPPTSDPP